MSWLIAILVIALVLGPIMYVLPSPQDKRIMALRMRARELGLEVKLGQVPKLDPEGHERVSSSGVVRKPMRSCTSYRIAHDSEALRTQVALELLRLPEQTTVPVVEVFPGWGVIDPNQQVSWQAHQSYWRNWLQELPPEVIAFAVDDRFLALSWRELGEVDAGVVEALSEALNSARLHFSS